MGMVLYVVNPKPSAAHETHSTILRQTRK